MSPVAVRGNGRHPSLPDDEGDHECIMRHEIANMRSTEDALLEGQGRMLGEFMEFRAHQTAFGETLRALVVKVDYLSRDTDRLQSQSEITQVQTREELIARVRAAEEAAKRSVPPAGIKIEMDRSTLIKIVLAIVGAFAGGGGLVKLLEVMK
jgi:hypothetical protein